MPACRMCGQTLPGTNFPVRTAHGLPVAERDMYRTQSVKSTPYVAPIRARTIALTSIRGERTPGIIGYLMLRPFSVLILRITQI